MNKLAILIESLGGPAKVARHLSGELGEAISTQVVYSWAEKGRLPSWRVSAFGRLVRLRGHCVSDHELRSLGRLQAMHPASVTQGSRVPEAPLRKRNVPAPHPGKSG